MARVQTMVQLNEDLIDELDAIAASQGVSRSALIRRALVDFLEEVRSADIGLRIAAGYRVTPPETPDQWGTLESSGDSGTLELLQRLDAEESAAGHEPW